MSAPGNAAGWKAGLPRDAGPPPEGGRPLMYSEFWSNKAPQASGNAGDMLRELVRIGFEQAVARAEASARMARSLAGCRTPLDAIAVYQDWMVNESQRVVADMRRMAELTRTLLQQSSDAAILNTPVEPPVQPDAAGKPGAGSAETASAPGQSAPEPKPADEPSPQAKAGDLPEAKPKATAGQAEHTQPQQPADAKPSAAASEPAKAEATPSASATEQTVGQPAKTAGEGESAQAGQAAANEDSAESKPAAKKPARKKQPTAAES
jgi:DNA polymerase III gamma/tau subunit